MTSTPRFKVPREPDRTFVDFASLKRPRSPNTFLVAPEGLCLRARPDMVSPVFPVPPGDLFHAIATLVSSEPLWRLAAADPGQLRLAFVAQTPIFRFRDDVDVEVLPEAAGPAGEATSSRLAAYSRSRVGHSDLGANARRIRNLIKKLGAA